LGGSFLRFFDAYQVKHLPMEAAMERNIIYRLLLSLLLIAAGMVHQANGQDSGVMTLDQAITIALRNNREAKNARLEIAKADDKLDAYRTRRLPSFKINSLVSQPLNTIDTTFKQGVFGIYPGNVPVPIQDTVIKSSMNTTVLLAGQVTQPITQLRRIGFQIKQQQLAV
jgi:outer membrane protein TolC